MQRGKRGLPCVFSIAGGPTEERRSAGSEASPCVHVSVLRLLP